MKTIYNRGIPVKVDETIKGLDCIKSYLSSDPYSFGVLQDAVILIEAMEK